MTKNNHNDINDVLKTIQRAHNTFTYEVWIPSMKKNVPFKEISTSQQKRLLKSIIDSEVYNTEFIMALYTIIKENCTDESVDVNDLTIIDKLVIALKMRSVSIGNEVPIKLTSKSDDSIEISSSINLTKLLARVKKIIKTPSVETATHGAFTVTCGIPSILDEYSLESELRSNNEDIEIDNYDELRRSIGEKFLGETSKYVKRIEIESTQEDKEPTVIDFSQVKFADRIKLIESLPAKCMEHVLGYINVIEKETEKIVLYNGKYTHKSGEEEIFDYNLSLDGSFFIAS